MLRSCRATGSGKTHTISGDGTAQGSGFIPRALAHIFQNAINTDRVQYKLYLSYVELYNNEFRYEDHV